MIRKWHSRMGELSELIAEGMDREEAVAEVALLEQRIEELEEALRLAVNHLDYCGWGDSYERGCARDEGLPEKLAQALAQQEE